MRKPLIPMAAIMALSSLFSCSGNDDRQLNEPGAGATGPSTRSLLHDGVAREYILYVPDSYDGTLDVPLMLNFHGFGGTADQHLKYADMRSLAETDTFLLVYPQGTLLNGDPHWNAGLESEENKSGADDFGFVEALIAEISSRYRIDSTRVYACGYSNGAFFAYALACYHGDKIAAIGSVAGTMMEETYANCGPSHPTAVVSIHGTSDKAVPYDGGEGLLSVDAVLAYWTGFNKINTSPTADSRIDRGTTIERYSYGDGDNGTSVDHYKVVGGGHVWFDLRYDSTDTSGLIWDFVSRYSIDGLRR